MARDSAKLNPFKCGFCSCLDLGGSMLNLGGDYFQACLGFATLPRSQSATACGVPGWLLLKLLRQVYTIDKVAKNGLKCTNCVALDREIVPG